MRQTKRAADHNALPRRGPCSLSYHIPAQKKRPSRKVFALFSAKTAPREKHKRRAGPKAPPAAANMISVTLLDDSHKFPWLLKSKSARRVPLRCGTQFSLCLGLIVLRMTVAFAGEKRIKINKLHTSMKNFCLGKRISSNDLSPMIGILELPILDARDGIVQHLGDLPHLAAIDDIVLVLIADEADGRNDGRRTRTERLV